MNWWPSLKSSRELIRYALTPLNCFAGKNIVLDGKIPLFAFLMKGIRIMQGKEIESGN